MKPGADLYLDDKAFHPEEINMTTPTNKSDWKDELLEGILQKTTKEDLNETFKLCLLSDPSAKLVKINDGSYQIIGMGANNYFKIKYE
jgi:hypothetical protein